MGIDEIISDIEYNIFRQTWPDCDSEKSDAVKQLMKDLCSKYEQINPRLTTEIAIQVSQITRRRDYETTCKLIKLYNSAEFEETILKLNNLKYIELIRTVCQIETNFELIEEYVKIMPELANNEQINRINSEILTIHSKNSEVPEVLTKIIKLIVKQKDKVTLDAINCINYSCNYLGKKGKRLRLNYIDFITNLVELNADKQTYKELTTHVNRAKNYSAKKRFVDCIIKEKEYLLSQKSEYIPIMTFMLAEVTNYENSEKYTTALKNISETDNCK